MKKLFLILLLAVVTISCTDNARARKFGGTVDLWYIVKDMPVDYVPQKVEFTESSNLGIMNGKIIFVESK